MSKGEAAKGLPDVGQLHAGSAESIMPRQLQDVSPEVIRMTDSRRSHATVHFPTPPGEPSLLAVLLLLAALAPLLPFPRSHLLPRAQAAVDGKDLDSLKQFFRKDPATAFEKSWKMFQEPSHH
ncbi:MAG: hypothetical protein HY318_12665 [Armatimonadetes bacterium]|nr:hypothetical protein [Armatimonadota bacterium]